MASVEWLRSSTVIVAKFFIDMHISGHTQSSDCRTSQLISYFTVLSKATNLDLHRNVLQCIKDRHIALLESVITASCVKTVLQLAYPKLDFIDNTAAQRLD